MPTVLECYLTHQMSILVDKEVGKGLHDILEYFGIGVFSLETKSSNPFSSALSYPASILLNILLPLLTK